MQPALSGDRDRDRDRDWDRDRDSTWAATRVKWRMNRKSWGAWVAGKGGRDSWVALKIISNCFSSFCSFFFLWLRPPRAANKVLSSAPSLSAAVLITFVSFSFAAKAGPTPHPFFCFYATALPGYFQSICHCILSGVSHGFVCVVCWHLHSWRLKAGIAGRGVARGGEGSPKLGKVLRTHAPHTLAEKWLKFSVTPTNRSDAFTFARVVRLYIGWGKSLPALAHSLTY